MSTDRFERFDAAYVLGALDPDEQTEFEQHLIGCAACRARVAELSSLPALLAQAPAEAFAVADPPPPDGLLLSLQREVRRSRNRRRWYYAAGAAAAAVVLVLTTALIAHHNGPAHPATPPAPVAAGQPMTNVSGAPMHIDATLTGVAWGTRIDLRCTYDASVTSVDAYSYDLTVVDRAGVAHAAGSWMATPGRVSTWRGGTAVSAGDIAELEVTAPGVSSPLLVLRL